MLKFIKNFFKTEEPKPSIEVPRDKLLAWFDRHVYTENMQNDFKSYVQNIQQTFTAIQQNITALEQAEIKEQDQVVEGKVKNIVSGHRDNYARELKRFIGLIEYPESYSLGELVAFNNLFNSYLDEFSQRSAKSYQATQHLFFKEVETIFNDIKLLSKFSQKFSKQTESLHQVQQVRTTILSLHDMTSQKEKMHSEVESKNKRLQQTVAQKKEAECELEQAKLSDDYQYYTELQEKLKNFDSEKERIGYDVFSIFSKLSRALRKQERLSPNKRITSYLDNPMVALIDDNELGIVSILNQLQLKIRNEEIHHTSRISNVTGDDNLTFSRVLYVLNFTQEST